MYKTDGQFTWGTNGLCRRDRGKVRIMRTKITVQKQSHSYKLFALTAHTLQIYQNKYELHY